MAEYTIQLRTLLETDFDPQLNDYPIFDENYRAILNRKILNHYYMHEIGYETPDLFNHEMMVRMDEIMPYYNEMYRIQSLIVNPFHNFEHNETSTRQIDNTSQENVTGENVEDTTQETSTNFEKGQVRSHSAQSDTPQSNLTPYNVAEGGYATQVNMTETESDADTTTGTTGTDSRIDTATQSSGTMKTIDEYIKMITGSQGANKPDMLKTYRSAFMNIDREIIKELRDLFMIVY